MLFVTVATKNLLYFINFVIMWPPYLKDKISGSCLLCCGDISPTLLQHYSPLCKLPKKKKKTLCRIMKNGDLVSQNRISFSLQSSECLKTHSEAGKGFFVAFADVSGINTTARFKPSMWSQPAHWKFNKWLWADSGTPLGLLTYPSAGCIHVVTKLYQGTQWPGSPYWVPNLVWVAELTWQE